MANTFTYTKYVFPVANPTDICLVQNASAGTNLVINGNLANSNSTVKFAGYCRTISFSCSGNVSNVKFTIAGTQNGAYVTQTLNGPNNGITYTSDPYDEVYAITVDSNVSNVSVGTGIGGFFKLIPIDLSKNPTNYALSISSLLGTNQYSTAIWSTLEEISNNGYTYNHALGSVGTLNTIKPYGNNGNLYILPTSSLVKYLLIQINGFAEVAANGLTLTFIQT